MRLPSIAIAAVFAAGLGLSASAETPPAPPPPPAPPAQTTVDPEQAKQDDLDKEVVCRTQEDTGSRLSKRKTCMTRKEWRDSAQ